MIKPRRTERRTPRLRLQARGFRSLRDVDVELGAFHVLVGPNGSGKSTFLDAIAMIGDLVTSPSLPYALGKSMKFAFGRRVEKLRVTDARGLTWRCLGRPIALAVEASVPATVSLDVRHVAPFCRYEVEFDVTGAPKIVSETFSIGDSSGTDSHSMVARQATSSMEITGQARAEPWTVEPEDKGWRKIVQRSGDHLEDVSYQSETSADLHRFQVRSDRSAFAGLPADEGRFPVANWFRNRFSRPPIEDMDPDLGRALLTLDPSRPSADEVAESVHRLQTRSRQRHADWVRHVREAVPDTTNITTEAHPGGLGRYLVLKCRNGLELPPWLVSDGTMRVLAMTLLPYTENLYESYLIEEPEHGIHPYAIETVFQSLCSVYDSQVLLTTHSPLVARLAKPSQLLCFSTDQEGATQIVPASDHPLLKDWLDSVDFGTLLASGILG